MKKRCSQTREIKNIGSPCFDSYPNQYSILPTKDNEPKVIRQSSFSGINGTNTLNNSHTPKVLSRTIVESDMTTMKRNSFGQNHARPFRSIDDEKF